MAQGAMTERCCRTGARNQPGLFRQLLTPLRHGFAMPPPLKGRLFHCPLSTGVVYGLHTISCIYPYNRQQFLVVFPLFREIIPGK